MSRATASSSRTTAVRDGEHSSLGHPYCRAWEANPVRVRPRMPYCSQGVISLLHAALRRRRFVVQVHVRAPLSLPLCLSSYRAGFVNPYDGRPQGLRASPTRGSSLKSEVRSVCAPKIRHCASRVYSRTQTAGRLGAFSRMALPSHAMVCPRSSMFRAASSSLATSPLSKPKPRFQ